MNVTHFLSCRAQYKYKVVHLSLPIIRFRICGGLNPQMSNPQIQRAHYIHCTRPFYVRDLSIHGFWYLKGLLAPWIPRDDCIVLYSQGLKSEPGM